MGDIQAPAWPSNLLPLPIAYWWRGREPRKKQFATPRSPWVKGPLLPPAWLSVALAAHGDRGVRVEEELPFRTLLDQFLKPFPPLGDPFRDLL